jgi:AraC-like DNA-binding protein
VDVLSDLLHRARAKNAVVRQVIQRPPWSLTLADAHQLTAVATLAGKAVVTLADGQAHHLAAGDIALVKGGHYTIADSVDTPGQVIIRAGHKQVLDGSAVARRIGPRTYGAREPGATTMLHGIYRLHGSAGERFLDLLPRITVLPAGPRTRLSLELLSVEAERDEPGQDAVLNRLLDLILVIALRAWGARSDGLGALADPIIGRALERLHADPRHRWTTAGLAAEVGVSRAALSARFTDLVGTPPMTYLTGWRMTLAADALRDTDASVADVARDVGYDNAFAFSTAFKRAYGQSPTGWRAVTRPRRH